MNSAAVKSRSYVLPLSLCSHTEGQIVRLWAASPSRGVSEKTRVPSRKKKNERIEKKKPSVFMFLTFSFLLQRNAPLSSSPPPFLLALPPSTSLSLPLSL
ncbi:hypothetical protein XENOCAPTIV_019130 [Xenoophorus captivus]|uniref:Uncharacterized protein n=1 Tax=Xenoophorus captivus TaxID=1517983 RepID=A0ABV0RUF1_9TELE